MKPLILERECDIEDAYVFQHLNLAYCGLESVKSAWEAQDIPGAKQALLAYFRTRTNVHFLFDYRGMPLVPINPNDSPYSFQSSLGFQGDLKEFCLLVAEKLMDNQYLFPGGHRGEYDLGKNFEHMIHFNFLEDQGKRHRFQLDMFTRGQFFESLAIRYHEKGEQPVLAKAEELLRQFFTAYSLTIEDGSPGTNRFQYTEDRDVMSVGWLTLVFISLLYTELPYAMQTDLAFELIKRIWFFGSQFLRFETDGYRPYNHHMWERGLVPFMLGVLLPEFPAFVPLKERGRAVVCRHVLEDFNEEGGYNEHSISYWAGAALGEMLFRGIYLAKQNQTPLLGTEEEERISRSFGVLAALASPGKSYPNLGDSGGPLIDPILELGITLTENSNCQNVLATRRGNPSAAALVPLDYCSSKTGFAAGRSSFLPEANYWLMSVKEACGTSGHNHMDMLSLSLTMGGEDILGEPYAGTMYHKIKMNSPQRGFMYNMSAHNTVLVHGRPVREDTDYANKWGVYRPDTTVTGYKSVEEGMYVKASHAAYTFCLHQREVVFLRQKGLWVRDTIERGNRQQLPHIQRWYLFPGVTYKAVDAHTLLLFQGAVTLLCLFEEDTTVTVKKPAILCPAIYATTEELGYCVDVEFATPPEQFAENTPSITNTFFLHIKNDTTIAPYRKDYTQMKQAFAEETITQWISGWGGKERSSV